MRRSLGLTGLVAPPTSTGVFQWKEPKTSVSVSNVRPEGFMLPPSRAEWDVWRIPPVHLLVQGNW